MVQSTRNAPPCPFEKVFPSQLRRDDEFYMHLAYKLAIDAWKVDEVPIGGILLFSAHGVSPEIRSMARERRLQTVDATCPLVTKVHLEAIRYANQGYHILLIGHEGHDEVIGTMGEAPRSITLVETPDDVARLRRNRFEDTRLS